MAGRSYTQATIKTLFGQAQTCAFPSCTTPLIFTDPTRGGDTVVAEIAHIRSEVPAGPRHDATYLGDIDGPDNLVLLCGVHHRPVDRHESIYPTADLIVWKSAQRAIAGPGIELSTEDVIRFTGFTAEERAAITAMAKLCSKIERLTTRGLDKLAAIESARQYDLMIRYGAADFTGLDRQELDGTLAASWESSLNRILTALDGLAGEVAVLEMMSPALGPAAREVLRSSEEAATSRGDLAGGPLFAATHVAVRQLWLLANPA